MLESFCFALNESSVHIRIYKICIFVRFNFFFSINNTVFSKACSDDANIFLACYDLVLRGFWVVAGVCSG